MIEHFNKARLLPNRPDSKMQDLGASWATLPPHIAALPEKSKRDEWVLENTKINANNIQDFTISYVATVYVGKLFDSDLIEQHTHDGHFVTSSFSLPQVEEKTQEAFKEYLEYHYDETEWDGESTYEKVDHSVFYDVSPIMLDRIEST